MQDVNRAGLSALEMPTATARDYLPSPSTGTCGFDLTTYARNHRLRTRNLHVGHPAPPVRLTPRQRIGERTGYLGDSDRLDERHGFAIARVAVDTLKTEVCWP